MKLLAQVPIGLLYAFIYALKGVVFVIDLPSRLMGCSTTKEDVMTREAVIRSKAQRRLIHDIMEAERFNVEAACRQSSDERELHSELTASL